MSRAMSMCPTCARSHVRVVAADGLLYKTARAAAASPTPKNLAAVEAAKADREQHRANWRAQTASCCQKDGGTP